MKIAVFSDTHGITPGMLETIREEKPDYVFHLGDYGRDAFLIERDFPRIPVAEVKGNCDFVSESPEKREFELYGRRFFLTHGHRYGVKTGLEGLKLNASLAGADIVLFGHTHIPYYEKSEEMIFINPGSMGYGNTYAILEISDGNVNCFLKKHGN